MNTAYFFLARDTFAPLTFTFLKLLEHKIRFLTRIENTGGGGGGGGEQKK